MFIITLGKNKIGGNIYFAKFIGKQIDRTISTKTAKKFTVKTHADNDVKLLWL